MSDKEENLIERFKKLEAELVELLKVDGVDFSDSDKKQAVKSKLKAYIKKVEKARLVFDEYEKVAKDIEKMSVKENVSSDVVALRKENKTEEIEKYVDEIMMLQGQTKVVKKKKKSQQAREF